MQLSIYTKSPDAQAVSYLLAKNPNNVHERHAKNHAVRFVYHTMTSDELYATIFVTPDALSLVNDEQAYDITHYINDREFAVSTIFLSLIRSALGTALNGKPKEEYEKYVSQRFPFTFEVGPVATSLTDEEIRALWQPLGYEVTIQTISEQKRARFLTLTNMVTLQQALQQLFILIPVMDDYKHYFIDEKEQERLQRYGEGWLDTHPMRAMIYKKALRFRHLLNEAPEEKRISLNTQRYEAIVKQVEKLPHRFVIDMGAGEGKLTERLAQLKTIDTLYAVDPSNTALAKMTKRFHEADFAVTPTIQWGSLYYEDATFSGADVFILCEVIEHINEERLMQMMQLITDTYAPKNMIITTPNAEYNAVYELEEMRHDDHRFEWTRTQFQAWCKTVAPQYDLYFEGIGDEHALYGTPTQMCVMTRRD
ncbi:MAG: methyltransferase domain-containing protein [Lysinibacillus sp.]